jgi:hypothetical protein
MASGALYRLTWISTGGTGVFENVWFLRGATGVETSQTILAAVYAWRAAYKAVMPNDLNLAQIVCQQLTPFPLLVDTQAVTENGTASGGQYNSQVAAIITWRTALAGKKYRGRSYLSAPSGWFSTPNIMNNTGLTAMATFGASVLANFTDLGPIPAKLGVYSRVIGGGGPLYNVSGWHDVTTFSVQPFFGAQRRRRIGRGA